MSVSLELWMDSSIERVSRRLAEIEKERYLEWVKRGMHYSENVSSGIPVEVLEEETGIPGRIILSMVSKHGKTYRIKKYRCPVKSRRYGWCLRHEDIEDAISRYAADGSTIVETVRSLLSLRSKLAECRDEGCRISVLAEIEMRGEVIGLTGDALVDWVKNVERGALLGSRVEVI